MTTIEQAEAEYLAALEPAGPKAAAVLIDRLFSVLPLPDGAGLAVWIEMLSEYPAPILKAAIDDCIRTHKWNSPPSIADVVSRVTANPAWRDMWQGRRDLGCARILMGKPSKTAPRDPEDAPVPKPVKAVEPVPKPVKAVEPPGTEIKTADNRAGRGATFASGGRPASPGQ